MSAIVSSRIESARVLRTVAVVFVMKGSAGVSPIKRDALAQLNAAAKSVMATDGVGAFLAERLVPTPSNAVEVGPVKREFAGVAVEVEASKKDEASFRVRAYSLEYMYDRTQMVLDFYPGIMLYILYTHTETCIRMNEARKYHEQAQ